MNSVNMRSFNKLRLFKKQFLMCKENVFRKRCLAIHMTRGCEQIKDFTKTKSILKLLAIRTLWPRRCQGLCHSTPTKEE